jgi:hypothetical protein
LSRKGKMKLGPIWARALPREIAPTFVERENEERPMTYHAADCCYEYE